MDRRTPAPLKKPYDDSPANTNNNGMECSIYVQVPNRNKGLQQEVGLILELFRVLVQGNSQVFAAWGYS